MYLPPVKNLNILLPFSWLYGLGVWIRNRMFDMGHKSSISFEKEVAVICVGNLAVGGTGKTPHTEYLVSLLQREGIGPIAVLSRGYKRQSKGFVLAKPGVSASELGDESYQLYRKYSDIIVAVDADRCHGIRQLLKLEEPPKVILLDDAMQHRYVKPGLTICLTSFNRILYKDKLLPVGRLREPAANVSRADVVLVTKCPPLRSEQDTEIRAKLPTRLDQPVFYSAYRYGKLVNLDTRESCDIDHATEVLIVTGIADPKVMENYVQTHYRLLDIMTFGDHHRFSSKDIRMIGERLDNVNVAGYCTSATKQKAVIITTEKDAVRLINHPAVTDDLRKRIYYLPTEVYFFQEQQQLQFDNIVLDYVRKDRS